MDPPDECFFFASTQKEQSQYYEEAHNLALHRKQQDLAELLSDIAVEWPEIDPTLTGEHPAQPVAYFKRRVQEATDLASEIARTREDQYFSWTAQSSNNRGRYLMARAYADLTWGLRQLSAHVIAEPPHRVRYCSNLVIADPLKIAAD